MFQVDKNAWHYRWMVFYQSCLTSIPKEYIQTNARFHPKDFCSYWRNVLLWPGIRIGLNLLVWLALVLVVSFSGMNGLVGLASFTGMSIIFLAIVGVLVAIGFGFKLLGRKTMKAVANDDMIAKAYHSYKENYCPFVEYKD